MHIKSKMTVGCLLSLSFVRGRLTSLLAAARTTNLHQKSAKLVATTYNYNIMYLPVYTYIHGLICQPAYDRVCVIITFDWITMKKVSAQIDWSM